MNVGEMTQYFIDSNIWLYRFIVNTNDANSIKKQQIPMLKILKSWKS